MHLKYLFKEFTAAYNNKPSSFKDYRRLACDGSDINIAHNPKDQDTYFKNGETKGFNQIHLNAMYDLLDRIYTDIIIQEIGARLILYNFCEIITAHVTIQKCTTKHTYQINYTFAIHICRYFISKMAEKSLPDVEAFIHKEILPVRPGRHDPRKIAHKKAVSFVYHVA